MYLHTAMLVVWLLSILLVVWWPVPPKGTMKNNVNIIANIDKFLFSAIPFCVGLLIGGAMCALVLRPEWFGV